jgi:transposase-like protein
MAASRLSDAQKEEIVAAYRQGAAASALANAFGCSPATVSRVVKAALSPAEVAALKQQRGRREAAPAGAVHPTIQVEELPAAVADAAAAVADAAAAEVDPEVDPEGVRDTGVDGPGVLAIDDADDFAGEEGEPEPDQDGDELEENGSDDLASTAGPVAEAGQEPVQCRCLSEAKLPAAAYLLVDKTVELQPVALSACADLGPLPEEESMRQALQVYVNPRQAKRQCGRSQRVIPLPDLSLLQRTAPYLLAQGISRVVIEGSLYSLPGS